MHDSIIRNAYYVELTPLNESVQVQVAAITHPLRNIGVFLGARPVTYLIYFYSLRSLVKFIKSKGKLIRVAGQPI